jgi:hypothetical protein
MFPSNGRDGQDGPDGPDGHDGCDGRDGQETHKAFRCRGAIYRVRGVVSLRRCVKRAGLSSHVGRQRNLEFAMKRWRRVLGAINLAHTGVASKRAGGVLRSPGARPWINDRAASAATGFFAAFRMTWKSEPRNRVENRRSHPHLRTHRRLSVCLCLLNRKRLKIVQALKI